MAAQERMRRQLLDIQTATIRSDADLQRFLAENSDKETPFSPLSERAMNEFLKGLTFSKVGISSYRYDGIQSELNVRQAYELLTLFGAQTTLSSYQMPIDDSDELSKSIAELIAQDDYSLFDYEGYKCEGPGTCGVALHKICLVSGCVPP